MKKTLLAVMTIIIFAGTVSCMFIDGTERTNWRFIDPDEEYLRLELDGVIYTQKGITEWMPGYTGDLIEIASHLYAYEDETKHIFLLLWENQKEKNGAQLFIREGVSLPAFDSENVDEIYFLSPSGQISDEKTYNFSHRDSEVIDNLFVKMTNAPTLDNSKYNEISGEGRMKIVGEIIYSNDELEGIYVVNDIFAMGDEYWLFMKGLTHYVELSKEELSELVGLSMPEASEFSRLTIEEIYDFYIVDIK